MTEAHELRPKDLLMYSYIKRYMNKDTKEAHPSYVTLKEDTGLSTNTIRNSIDRLVQAGYIKVDKYGKCNSYKFLKWNNFEPCSFEFLSNKDLTFNEKAYILASQQYMFKDVDKEIGTITYSNAELADKINTAPKTIKKYDESLQDKGFLDIVPTNRRDYTTGLNIIQKNFHLTKFQQGIVFALTQIHNQTVNNTNRIDNIESRLDKYEKGQNQIIDMLSKLQNKDEIKITL